MQIYRLQLPNTISEKEHTEVYNWFSNHRVNWAYTPTTCDDPNSRKCKDDQEIAYEINKDFDYGSLSAYSGNANIFTEFEVNWAWVQYVANDQKKDETYYDHNQEKEVISDADGSKMNLLCFQIENSETYLHLLDFNNGKGKGYGVTDKKSVENAILVYGCNFNQCIFNSSVDGSHQFNKYILTYLKGDGYEGWYLGMDIEGFGNNDNEKVKANGICNDWIIKLTIPMSKINTGKPARIMCEDLGGVYDYDFNDIVIDVTPKKDLLGPYLNIEVKALGGTLPIYVAYNGTALWGTDDLHKKYNAVGKPVNVSKNNIDNAANGAVTSNIKLERQIYSKTWLLNDYTNYLGLLLADELDYNLIQIFIKPSAEAQWIQLANFAGKTPLKICVPQTVKWTIECAAKPGTSISPKASDSDYQNAGRSIGSAYPAFIDWVKDPSVEFWNNSNGTYLMP